MGRAAFVHGNGGEPSRRSFAPHRGRNRCSGQKAALCGSLPAASHRSPAPWHRSVVTARDGFGLSPSGFPRTAALSPARIPALRSPRTPTHASHPGRAVLRALCPHAGLRPLCGAVPAAFSAASPLPLPLAERTPRGRRCRGAAGSAGTRRLRDGRGAGGGKRGATGTPAGTGRKSSTAAPEELRGGSQRGRARPRDARGRRRSAASRRIGADPGVPRWRPGSSSCFPPLSRKTGFNGEKGTASRFASVRTDSRFSGAVGGGAGCSGCAGPERCVSPPVAIRKAQPSVAPSGRGVRSSGADPRPPGLSGVVGSALQVEVNAWLEVPRGVPPAVGVRSPAPEGSLLPPTPCDVMLSRGCSVPSPLLWVPPCASALLWGESCRVAVGSSSAGPTPRRALRGVGGRRARGCAPDVLSLGVYGEQFGPPSYRAGVGVPKTTPQSLLQFLPP